MVSCHSLISRGSCWVTQSTDQSEDSIHNSCNGSHLHSFYEQPCKEAFSFKANAPVADSQSVWGEPTELNREFNSCAQRVVGGRCIVLKGCWLYLLRLFSFCIYAFSHAPVQKLIKKAGMQPHFLFSLYSPLSSIFVSPCHHHHHHHPSPPLSSACCLLHPVLGSRACLVFLDHRGLILAEVCLEGTKRRRDCLEFQCVWVCV